MMVVVVVVAKRSCFMDYIELTSFNFLFLF